MEDVKVVDVRTVGLTRNRVQMRLDLPRYPDQNQINSIEYAAKHVLAGRQVVLSADNIEFNSTAKAPLDSEAHKALTARDEDIRRLQAKLDARDEQYAELKAENERLQGIFDALDGVFYQVNLNSTRGKKAKEARDNFMKRCGV